MWSIPRVWQGHNVELGKVMSAAPWVRGGDEATAWPALMGWAGEDGLCGLSTRAESGKGIRCVT